MSTLFSEIDTMKKQGMTNTQIASVYDGKYSVKYIDEFYARQKSYNLACTLPNDDERVLQVGKLRAQKTKPYYIAKELSMPVSLVSAIIKVKDLYIKKRLTNEQKAMLRDCAEKGLTIKETAELNGLEYFQVQGFAKNYKVKFVKQNDKKRMNNELKTQARTKKESNILVTPNEIKTLAMGAWL